MDTITGNKLIQNFMGAGGIVEEYDCYWESLMPVVERIEAVGYNVNILRQNCSIYSDLFRNTNQGYRETYYDGESKRSIVWEAIVKFIVYYNTQTPSK
ncbi:MAG: hypothetical protein ABI091_23380 [Ferruginibacter sp.]